MEFDFGFGSKTIYLVDSENLNDAWVGAISDLGNRDQIFVFYTENSANMSVASISQLTARENQVIWKRCFTGTNALDFQLVSQLGALIARHPRDTFIILSNDTGYDPVVRYWTVEGIKISRTSVQTGTPRARRTSRGGVRYSSRSQNRSTPPAYLTQAKKNAQTASSPTASKPAAANSASQNAAQGKAKETAAAEVKNTKPETARNAVSKVSKDSPKAAAKAEDKNTEARNRKQKSSEAAENTRQTDELLQAQAAVTKAQGSEETAASAEAAALAETPEEKPSKSKKQKTLKADRSEKGKTEDGEKKKKKKKDKSKKQDESASVSETPEIVTKTPEEVALELTAVSAETELPPVFDEDGNLHPSVAAFIEALGAALPAKGLGEYHEALVHVLGSEDGNAAYQVLRGDREWQQRLAGRLLDGKDQRADAFIGAFLGYLGYPAADADRIKDIIFAGNSTNYAGLYRSFVHSFGATRGRQYYSLFKSSLKTIQQL